MGCNVPSIIVDGLHWVVEIVLVLKTLLGGSWLGEFALAVDVDGAIERRHLFELVFNEKIVWDESCMY